MVLILKKTESRTRWFRGFPPIARPLRNDAFRSGEELFQRVPVVAVPARIQVIVLAGGEAGVVEDQGGFRVARIELEVGDGVDAGVPVSGAPSLYDALV